MEPLLSQGDVGSSSEGLGRLYFAQGLRFYKLFVLRSDLSIHEAIVYCTTQPNAKVEDITWSRVYQPNKSVRTIGTIQELDDFLEPDGIEAMDSPLSKLPSQTPEYMQGDEHNTARRVSDHTLLYDTLTQKETTTANGSVVIAQMKQLLAENSDGAQLPLGTL
jgi:RNA polymerase I-specific transcription initiation factor RRN6